VGKLSPANNLTKKQFNLIATPNPKNTIILNKIVVHIDFISHKNYLIFIIDWCAPGP